MDVPVLVWTVTVGAIVAMLALGLLGHVRTPPAPTLRGSAIRSAAYVGIAILFGLLVWWGWGAGFAGEYFAGFVTEKSLSVDNLFVYVLVMAASGVPLASLLMTTVASLWWVRRDRRERVADETTAAGPPSDRATGSLPLRRPRRPASSGRRRPAERRAPVPAP